MAASTDRCRPNLNGTQRVALQVVRQHFGEPAEEICDALLKRPRRSLKELQQDCPNIPVGQLRNGLLVLIQHNLVTAVVDASGKSKECRYKFDPAEAVLRLRFPKFSTHIRTLMGQVAEGVMEAILDHGRATWDQIKLACPDVNEDKLREACDQLLERRYLMRMVSGSLGEEDNISVPSYNSTSKAPTSKPGSKRAASSSLAQQRPSKARRVDADGGEGSWWGQGRDVNENNLDDVPASAMLWRVNPEAFTWDFRATAITHLAQDVAGSESGSLVPMLLKAVRLSALAHRMQPVSVDDILEMGKGEREQANVNISWESVSERLMTLSQDGLIKRVNDGGGTCFEPDLRKLHRSVRLDIVERVVEAKMGWQARRVLKLLLHHQLLESKMVWDLAMLPKKDANEVLCRMLKSGYVGLQEVPRTQDHSAQRTFFLWYVDLDKVVRQVEDDILRSVHLLLLKREEKRLESEDLIGVGGEVSDLATAPAQMQQYTALQASIERLEQAVLRLDETLLLLSDP